MGLQGDFSKFIALEKRIKELKKGLEGLKKLDIDVTGKDITVDEADEILTTQNRISKDNQELSNLTSRLEKLEVDIVHSLLHLRVKSISVTVPMEGDFKVSAHYQDDTDENGDEYSRPVLVYTKS